jgi:ferredoxin
MSRMCRIEIDLDKCVGSRICVAIAPKAFDLNSDGQATVLDHSDETLETIKMAAEGCPVSAITVHDDES